MNFLNDNDDDVLNCHISENEILKCIKNNKTCSNDGIINESIEATENEMMLLYVTFFNSIFNTGALPDSWLEGVIRPIYENKGDSNRLYRFLIFVLFLTFKKSRKLQANNNFELLW